jgi:hypothetical protein
MKKKSNGKEASVVLNEVGPPQRPARLPIPVPVDTQEARDVGTVIEMSEQQKQLLQKQKSDVSVLIAQLGELDMAMEDLTVQRQALIAKIREAQGGFMKTANGVMASYGINTEDPAQGVWSLNFTDGRIQRTA